MLKYMMESDFIHGVGGKLEFGNIREHISLHLPINVSARRMIYVNVAGEMVVPATEMQTQRRIFAPYACVLQLGGNVLCFINLKGHFSCPLACLFFFVNPPASGPFEVA